MVVRFNRVRDTSKLFYAEFGYSQNSAERRKQRRGVAIKAPPALAVLRPNHDAWNQGMISHGGATATLTFYDCSTVNIIMIYFNSSILTINIG